MIHSLEPGKIFHYMNVTFNYNFKLVCSGKKNGHLTHLCVIMTYISNESILSFL